MVKVIANMRRLRETGLTILRSCRVTSELKYFKKWALLRKKEEKFRENEILSVTYNQRRMKSRVLKTFKFYLNAKRLALS
jgi:hypothetical protein